MKLFIIYTLVGGETGMSPTKKAPLTLHYNSEQKLLSGVGPGIGYEFIKAYFPQAQRVIRIASAYFTLTGYKLGRQSLAPDVQFKVLVGREEGKHVQTAVIEEILEDLGQCETDIWETVFDLVERMKRGQFAIRDAREMQTKFHCKFYICDDMLMWHGSANYTGSGLQTNAEQVSLSRDTDQIQQFTEWYDEVAQDARDLLAELIAKLEEWLKLASPFDIYLKTLLLLNNLPDLATRPEAHPPVYYQKGVIARALRQAEDYGGAFIVAATGLGKTIIGAEIAWRLHRAGKANNVILIAPDGVRENWEDEFDGRRIPLKFFNIGVLFRQGTRHSHHKATKLDKQLRQADHQTVIIIDEAHFYRNQLLSEKSKGRKSRVYQRLEPLVNSGAKIFLLTATAYGTNYQNLDSLLYLLPHRSPNLLDSQNPWRAKDAEEFARLPVVTVLGLPHVLKMARDQGHIENNRTFIQFANERRYLPKTLRLHSVRYELSAQPELQAAFDSQCFEQAYKFRQHWYDDETRTVQLGLIDTVYNASLIGWLSSPISIVNSIKQNLATPSDQEGVEIDNSNEAGSETDPLQLNFWGRPTFRRKARSSHRRSPSVDEMGRQYGTPMHLSLLERSEILQPLLEILSTTNYATDDKFQKLKTIIENRCLGDRSKVIVFVGRLLTALYLTGALAETLGDQLRIGSTVELSEVGPRLKASPYRSEILKQFSPRSHNYDPVEREYDVLICTDANGVGVNLQDADTLINYDPPEGADVLFQRAGRVLRMKVNPDRMVHFYTLVPSILEETQNRSRVQAVIREIFNRITRRHDKSQQILGSRIISPEEYTDINLDSNIDVEQLTRDSQLLKDIGGLGAEAMMSHTATLECFRQRAEGLPPYLLSARHYHQDRRRVFVLIEHQARYHPVMWNFSTQEIEKLDDLSILDLIQCSANEPRAFVKPADIEHLANEVAQAWCARNKVPLDQAQKICALYLIPKDDDGHLKTLFDDSLPSNDKAGSRKNRKP